MIRRIFNKVRRLFEPKVVVLMYHRVDTVRCDPWELVVSPAHFEEQLRLIRDKWNPISINDLAGSVAAGRVPDRSVVVTFDDGYIDNFEQARPLLEKYGIPATFFITTKFCEQQTLFWWDELQYLLLEAERLPEELSLSVAGEDLRLSLGDDAVLTPELQARQQSWIGFAPPPTRRCQAYFEIWRRLRPLTEPQQQETLATLRKLIEAPGRADGHVCMTPSHLRQLLTSPLFTLGAHTVTHAALADQPVERQQQEIRDSRAYLERLTDRPVTLFAYPYGSYSEATVDLLTTERFSAAVTTQGGAVTKNSHSLCLNRYQVPDWSGPEFEKRVSRWFRN